MAGGVGVESQTANGILQGCPLNVIFFSLLVSEWGRAVEHETGVQPTAYADDTSVVGSASEVARAGALTLEYCRARHFMAMALPVSLWTLAVRLSFRRSRFDALAPTLISICSPWKLHPSTH